MTAMCRYISEAVHSKGRSEFAGCAKRWHALSPDEARDSRVIDARLLSELPLRYLLRSKLDR